GGRGEEGGQGRKGARPRPGHRVRSAVPPPGHAPRLSERYGPDLESSLDQQHSANPLRRPARAELLQPEAESRGRAQGGEGDGEVTPPSPPSPPRASQNGGTPQVIRNHASPVATAPIG